MSTAAKVKDCELRKSDLTTSFQEENKGKEVSAKEKKMYRMSLRSIERELSSYKNILLSFEKDGQSMMITVSIEDGRTNVIVTTIDQ